MNNKSFEAPLRIRDAAFSLRRLTALAAGLGLTLCLGAVARAQEPADDFISMNLIDTDVRAAVQAVMEIMDKNFVIDPRVNGQVTMIVNDPLPPDEFYAMFEAALSVNDWQIVESSGVAYVLMNQTARSFPFETVTGSSSELAVELITLANHSVNEILPALRPLVNATATTVAQASTNSILIVDRRGNVDKVREILRIMDQPNVTTESIRLENASATDVVAKLTELTQAGATGVPGPTVSFVPYERTNTLLMTGNPAQRARYRPLIEELDARVDFTNAPEVRKLEFADALDVSTILLEMFGGTVATEEVPGAPGEGGLTISAYEPTNAIIMTGPSRLKADIHSVIDALDVRSLQVAVDMLIVEVSDDKMAELGVTWVTAGDDDLFTLTNFGSTVPGIAQLGQAAQGDTPSAAALQDGALVGFGRVRDGGTSWAAIVSALQGDSETHIVAQKQLTIVDNITGTINFGQQIQIPSGSFTNAGGGQGVVNPFNTFDTQDIGLLLTVTPRINESNSVTLEIEQENSSLGTGTTGSADLVINQREITTTAIVDDGNYLILGGLVDDRLLQGEQRVPFLGRIPVIKHLFSARDAQRTQQNLYVFIRAEILRTPADADRETSRNYENLRDTMNETSEDRIRLLRDAEYPRLPSIDINERNAPAAEEPED